MIKSEVPCSGCGNSHYIQNKRYHLCSDCVYKKRHGGKSKQQTYIEKQEKKKGLRALRSFNQPSPIIDEQELIFINNKQAQDSITEEEDAGERKFRKSLERKTKKKKSFKKISTKQNELNKQYLIILADIDYTREKVCSGCLQYQGGDIKLSHSHIIARSDAKGIGKPELIVDPDNITYHCLDFGQHKGCHNKWANPTQRKQLEDYERNIEYIKRVAPELCEKYLAK